MRCVRNTGLIYETGNLCYKSAMSSSHAHSIPTPQQVAAIRLAFFDVDGTVLDSHDRIGPKTTAMIRSLPGRGIDTALASGRPLFSARQIAETLGVTAPSVLFGGALVYDTVAETVISSCPLEAAPTRRLIDVTAKEGFYCELYTIDGHFINKMHPYAKIHQCYLKRLPEVTDLQRLCSEQVILKTVLIASGPAEAQRLRDLMKIFPEFSWGPTVGAMHPEVLFANGTNPLCARDKVLQQYLARRKLSPENVLSAGDGEADIPFLSRAGIGIALGNATAIVKAATPFEAPSVEADGLGCFLEAIFDKK